MKEICIDLETTGLPEAGMDYEIIEVSAIMVDKPKIRFNSYIKPSRTIDESALRYNKITKEVLTSAPSSMEVKSLFIEFLDNIKDEQKLFVIGYNYKGFDISFMKKWLGLEMYNRYFYYKSLDVDQEIYLLRGKLGIKEPYEKSLSLSNVSKLLKLSLPEHDAVGDCLMTIELYKIVKGLIL